MALAEPDEDEDEEEVETLELDSEPDFWSMTIWVHQAGGATKDVGAADASPSRVETVNSLAGKLKLVFHLIFLIRLNALELHSCLEFSLKDTGIDSWGHYA